MKPLPTEEDSNTSANDTSGDNLQRYEQLKVSVHALRSQVRPHSSPKPSHSSQRSPKLQSPLFQPPWTPFVKANNNNGSKKYAAAASSVPGIGCLVEEPAAIQLLRLQLQLEHEAETRKLKDKMNAKIKQIETLKLENARQKKKLQARLTYFDGRCQTLEAQLGEQRGKLQKELDEKQATFEESCRKDEDDHQRVLVNLSRSYEERINIMKKKYDEEYNKTQSSLMLDVDINDDLRNQVARLEAEVASVSSKVEEAQSYHKNKEKEWKLRLQCYGKIHDEKMATLRKEMYEQKATLERDKKSDEEKHAMDMSSYKQQKMAEIDCLTDRVKSALEAKDKNILQLKTEIKKLQKQFSQTTQMFQEQACALSQIT